MTLSPSSLTAILAAIGLVWSSPLCLADGPGDNSAAAVRPIPPPGIEVPAADSEALAAGLKELAAAIEQLPKKLTKQPALLRLLPDVQIYYKAVDYVLSNREFHKPDEIKLAQRHLTTGLARAAALAEGQAPWARQTGLVVRGYRSRIDGSIQPYGLVIPASYNFTATARHRLDIWLQGRGENTNEVVFINQHETNPGQIQPQDAIVLHPYGRYCNANKFAGEIDVLEAEEAVQQQYRIDDNRVVIRGFSMGGAACWQFAVHYTDRWMAATPGAGFAETRKFLAFFQNEDTTNTPAYQQKLWHWYDSTDYARNLANCPVIAYSGEVDRQKQAADLMEAAMKEEGLSLVHLIGPKMGHKIDPGSAAEFERRLAEIARVGRNPVPARVSLTTYTLRYPQMYWLRIDRMGEHWQKARLEAEVVDSSTVRFPVIENVEAFTISMASGHCPLDPLRPPTLLLGTAAQKVTAPSVMSDRSWAVHLRRTGGQWRVVEQPWGPELAKRPGLQGPIDDAFMDAFIMVQPTGTPLQPAAGDWLKLAQKHAVGEWRRQFRGDAPSKNDTDITDADIADNNLILWGDPGSNSVIARILGKLPITWTAAEIKVGTAAADGDSHTLAMIYPNPLNPERYIVINSGFTYREYDYLNNARQVAKLPDWAILDSTSPIGNRNQGDNGVPAGFFNEDWLP